jgi:hypothetical protein
MFSQIRKNAVALISLMVAISALTYTAWREERTEKNRTLRAAGFELLKNLGELQLIVNYRHYQPENSMGNPIVGWGHVAIISDMSQILPSPLPEKIDLLVAAWKNNWEKIKTDGESVDQISQEIDLSREAVLHLLLGLN